LSSGTTETLYSLFFPDANTGYVCGNGGIILKTQDAGLTWDPLNSGTTHYLESIYFIDANTGCAAGEHGTILKTTNGGLTWTEKVSGVYDILSSIIFTDPEIGYLCSNYGDIFRTLDAGETWTPLEHGTHNMLNSLYFTDVNHGVAVGGNTIIKTSNGSLQSIPEPYTGNSEFVIYPNPAIDNIIISHKGTVRGTFTIWISDAMGNEVLSEKFIDQPNKLINISNLPTGIFFVKIVSGDRLEVKKLIIR
jgi:photosystem II stability/assembly factor-like uncharacterized protein